MLVNNRIIRHHYRFGDLFVLAWIIRRFTSIKVMHNFIVTHYNHILHCIGTKLHDSITLLLFRTDISGMNPDPMLHLEGKGRLVL